jgi:hypothetical protein
MDHTEAVRQKATEKYLLDELDPEVRDQFEEHMFGCQECALDLRAAAMFVEQSKVALAESPMSSDVRVPVPARPAGWVNWFRPAFTIPVFAMLLCVIGYQDYLMRATREPQLPPWASLIVGTRAGGQDVEPIMVNTKPGVGFSLLVNASSDPNGSAETKLSSLTLELYNPAGRLQWSRQMAAPSPDDHPSIYIPGDGLEQGKYTLAIHKISATGDVIEKHPIQIQIQK